MSDTNVIINSTIGKNPTIWYFVNIYNSTIGDNVKIGSHTEIGNAKVGNNVSIGAKCLLCEGVVVEQNVFMGPNVIFTNDKYPPSSKEKWGKIVVRKGASIGAGCIILPNVEIGENALIGAGSVVTKSVASNKIVIGNPAKEYIKPNGELNCPILTEEPKL